MGILASLGPSEWAIVFATLAGPILAVQAQKRIERIRERINTKRWVFTTLMATRAQRLSQDHVRALNMIDLAFYGTKIWRFEWQSDTEKAVITAWNAYLDNLGTDIAQLTESQRDVLFGKRTDLFVALLTAIGIDVGYRFDPLHIEKSNYSPIGHENLEQEQTILRRALIEVMVGRKPIKMDLVSLPTQTGDPSQRSAPHSS